MRLEISYNTQNNVSEWRYWLCSAFCEFGEVSLM